MKYTVEIREHPMGLTEIHATPVGAFFVVEKSSDTNFHPGDVVLRVFIRPERDYEYPFVNLSRPKTRYQVIGDRAVLGRVLQPGAVLQLTVQHED